jgi:hypothetical protein
MSVTTGVTTPGSVTAPNVVPVTTYTIAQTIDSTAFRPGPQSYSPSNVFMDVAAAGFSTVIEFGSACCLRQFAGAAPPLIASAQANAQDVVAFAERARSAELEQALLEGAFSATSLVTVVAAFVPRDLEFLPRATLRVSYEGVFLILGVVTGSSSRRLRGLRLPHELIEQLELLGYAQDALMLSDLAGPRLTVELAYGSHVDATLAQIDVFAKTANSVAALILPPGDSERFWNQLLNVTADDAAALLASTAEIQLVPTVSLVGRNQAVVTEFGRLDVSLGAVGKHPSDALAVCLDAMPGASGTVASVQQFIGSQDYGVLSDAYVVERVFNFHWRRGGFKRSYSYSQMARFDNQGTPVDGRIEGSVVLTSLDSVSLETESNTRSDYITLRGEAALTIQKITLEDGTEIGPSDEPALGRPQTQPWASYTQPSLIDKPIADPELRDFQLSLSIDGYRALACPLANAPDSPPPVQASYGRLDAIRHYAMFLGKIDHALP